jgi:methylase of polypeptide subunit release factors
MPNPSKIQSQKTMTTRKFLNDLTESHSPPLVRAALIRGWAASNHVPLDNVKQGRVVSSFLQVEKPAARRLTEQVRAEAGCLSLKDIEGAFEHLIEDERQTAQGAFYTPNDIIDYLVEHSLEESNAAGAVPRICDPACGSAGFLVRAAEHLDQQHDIGPERAFAECLAGIDNDPWAVEHAQALIELYLASRGVALPGPEPHLLCRDTLLTDAEALRDEVGFPDGFDAVVTNPPYVKLQNLDPDYRERLTDAYAAFVKGSFGLAPLFLVAGLRLTAENGCMGVITQNNLFTSLAGGNVRQFLQEGRRVRRIIDFGHRKVFGNASAYTCLMFLSNRRTEAFEFESLNEKADADTLSNASFSTIRFDQLDAKKWRLAKGRHFDNLLKIEATGRPLGEVAKIKVGYATLKDAVFTAQKQNGRCLAEGPGGTLYDIETDATRPALKIADVERPEDVRSNTRRIIFPYRKRAGRHQLIPEDEFRSDYPKTYVYLEAHRDTLAGRDKGRKTYEGWYAWGRTQGREAAGPKLLTKTFNSEPRFYLDESDQLFCNGYALWLESDSLFGAALPLAALQCLLSSDLMHYYAKLTSFQIEGNYQCYQKNFIERFGIPSLTSKQTRRLLDLPADEADEYICCLYDIPHEDVEEVLAR